jgi:hypothetical protein
MSNQFLEYYILFNTCIIVLIILSISKVRSHFLDSSRKTTSDISIGYRYGDYTLYSKIVKLKNGKLQVIYFFSKKKPKAGTPVNMPYGYKIDINKRTGLPFLKRK